MSDRFTNIGLVKNAIQTSSIDKWIWFKVRPINPNQMIIALESTKYHGYFMDAHDSNGINTFTRMVKAKVDIE